MCSRLAICSSFLTFCNQDNIFLNFKVLNINFRRYNTFFSNFKLSYCSRIFSAQAKLYYIASYSWCRNPVKFHSETVFPSLPQIKVRRHFFAPVSQVDLKCLLSSLQKILLRFSDLYLLDCCIHIWNIFESFVSSKVAILFWVHNTL